MSNIEQTITDEELYYFFGGPKNVKYLINCFVTNYHNDNERTMPKNFAMYPLKCTKSNMKSNNITKKFGKFWERAEGARLKNSVFSAKFLKIC